MIKKLSLYFFITIVFLFSMSNIKAFKITSSNESKSYNGYDYMPFKKTGNTAVFCTKFHAQVPPSTQECSVDDDAWNGNPVKAGVGKIIDLAKASNDGMSQKYYYAELAINQFLYYHNGKNPLNRISSNRSTKTILGNYYDYYKEAVKAYNRVDAGPDVSLALKSGKKSYNINTDDRTSIQNVYTIASSNTSSVTVNIIAANLPEGTKLIVNGDEIQSNGTTISYNANSSYEVNQNVTVKLDNLQDAANISVKVSVTSSLNYATAVNYKCGSYQSVTKNQAETVSDTDKASAKFKVVTADEPNYPSLKVIKYDESNHKIDSPARIQIKKQISNEEEEVIYKGNTNNGELMFDDIEEGTYCVYEQYAPNGYFKKSDKHCFVVTKNDNNEVSVEKSISSDQNLTITSNLVTLSLYDELNQVSFTKVDSKGNNVAGARLKVVAEKYDTIEEVISAEAVKTINNEELEWVSELNEKVFEGLPEGDYYLYEVEPPSGYSINPDPIPFTITRKMTKAITVQCVNDKTYVSISKVDITSKEELPGATLRLLDENLKVVKIGSEELEWVSTNAPRVIDGLMPGVYYLEEIVAPPGYQLLKEKIKFTLDEYGVVTINNEEVADSVIVMTNNYNKHYFSKKDATSKDELAGAKLKIIDSSDNIIDEWTSTTETHLVEGLIPGKYKLVEITAPNGYEKAEDIDFTVKDDGTVDEELTMYDFNTVEIPDTKLTRSITMLVVGVILSICGVITYLYIFEKGKKNM